MFQITDCQINFVKLFADNRIGLHECTNKWMHKYRWLLFFNFFKLKQSRLCKETKPKTCLTQCSNILRGRLPTDAIVSKREIFQLNYY